MAMGSVGLWVGLGRGSTFSLWYGWVGLDQSFGGLGWVDEIGPTDNSACSTHFGTFCPLLGNVWCGGQFSRAHY